VTEKTFDFAGKHLESDAPPLREASCFRSISIQAILWRRQVGGGWADAGSLVSVVVNVVVVVVVISFFLSSFLSFPLLRSIGIRQVKLNEVRLSEFKLEFALLIQSNLCYQSPVNNDKPILNYYQLVIISSE